MTQRTLRRAVSDEDKQERRRQVLVAASEVFADRGYHDTTIADVARRAGLSYGVVYLYFDSKDALFEAVIVDQEDALRTAIARGVAAVVQPGDIADRLRAAVSAAFQHFESDPAATRLLWRLPRASGVGVETQAFGVFDRFTGDLENLISRAQEQHQLREVPPRAAAISCAGLISHLALRRLHTDDGMSAAEAADFLVDLLFDGLRPRSTELVHDTPTQGAP